MEPKIVSRPAFTVVGMKYRGKNENNEVPQLWGKFWPRNNEIQHKVNPQMTYGVLGNKDDNTGEFDYVAGFEVDSMADIPEGMVSWEVPEQTYAVFTCTLPTLMETFQYIFKTWLLRSAYEFADGPEFELYDENFDPEDENSEVYVYIPVK